MLVAATLVASAASAQVQFIALSNLRTAKSTRPRAEVTAARQIWCTADLHDLNRPCERWLDVNMCASVRATAEHGQLRIFRRISVSLNLVNRGASTGIVVVWH